MAGVGTPFFLAALWCLFTTPSAWARLGNRTTDRRLSERTTASTLPAFGCHKIRDLNDPAECCRHHDARGDPRYEGEPCTPSFSGTGADLKPRFSHGGICEPRCWTRGECGSGIDQGSDIGACPAPSRPTRYTLGAGGLTCQQQLMVDLTEEECYGQAVQEAVGVALFPTEANPGFNVPYGCFVLASQTCSGVPPAAYFQGARGPPSIPPAAHFQGAQGPQAQRASPCSDFRPRGTRWTDSLSRGCEFYAGDFYTRTHDGELTTHNGCMGFGDTFASFGGLTANKVCCVCGGGIVSYSPAPSDDFRYICGSLERVFS